MSNEKAMESEEMKDGMTKADQNNSSGKIQEHEALAHATKEMQ